MFNKFEAIGIGLSITAMVLALWLVRVETTNNMFATVSEQNNNAGAVFVADGENQRAAIADAVVEATEGGDLERMIIDDVVIGEGDAAEEGDTVTVHYIGTLETGQQFDNSYLKGAPFTFTIGEGRVIEGWEKGVPGMKVGGQRILVIPSDLAYGDSGFGPIPGRATLAFTVELISIDE